MMAKNIPKRPTMEIVNVHAAAVDIGSGLHTAAVDLDVTDAPIRTICMIWPCGSKSMTSPASQWNPRACIDPSR